MLFPVSVQLVFPFLSFFDMRDLLIRHNMMARLKNIALRFTVFSFLLTIILSMFHCSMREGDILGIRQPETCCFISADSYWSDFNFTDSTGTIRCSVTVDNLSSFTIKVGYHPDSLIASYTSEYPGFSFYEVEIFRTIYYQLTIISMTGDSLTDTGSITTPPGFPPRMVEGLNASSDYSGVYLEWQASQFASEYIVYRKEISGSTFDSIGVTRANHYYDSLQSFSRYYYTVGARNEFGMSRSATPVTGYKTINLTPPASLVASKGRYYHQIKLSWSPNTSAKSACIFRADSAEGPYREIASSITDSFYVDTVEAYTFYFYKVASQDHNGGCGPASAYDSGFASGILDPPEISDISEGHYEDKIFIYWNSVNQALAYRVYRSESINGEYKVIATTSDTFYVDYVNSTRNYYYEISTVSPDSQEGQRSLFKAGYVTKFDPPDLKIDRDSKSCILLYWDSIPGASHYKIYRTSHLDSQAVLIDSTEDNSYCDLVPSGKIWIYLMSVVNKHGVESRFSNAVLGEGSLLREPEKLTASEGTFQAYVALSWSPVLGATGYHLYRSTPNSSSILISSTITDTFYIDSSAVDSNYYRVCAIDSSGAEGYFSELVTGYPAALDIVKNLTGSVDIPHALQLSWDAVAIADSYIVYRSSSAFSGPYLPVDTVYEPVYADSNRHSAYFTVAVKYRSRTGRQAEPVFSKKLEPPSDLNFQLENNVLKLMWNQAMGATSYNVYKSTDTVHFLLLKNVKDNFCYDSSLSEGDNHYRVKSVSINGETANFSSTTISFKNGVQDFTVTASHDSLKLQWLSVPDAYSYQVICSDSNGNILFNAGTSNTFASFTFTKSGIYYFKIRANVEGYITPFSDTKSGRVIARPPRPNLIEAQSQTGRVVLTWSADPNGEAATGFVIYRSTMPTLESGYIALDTINDTTYTDIPPSVNTTYYYKVAGLNQSGVGAQSGYLSAKALLISPPQLLSVSNHLYGTHIAITWAKSNDAEKYIVGRAANSSSPLTIIDTCTDTFYNDSTVSSQSTFWYAVAAIKGTMTSDWSARRSGAKLPAPIIHNATGNELYIHLIWEDQGNAPKFYIYRSDSGDGPYMKIDSTTIEYYMDTVQSGIPYFYKVSAVNLNESELSQYDSARLKMPLPPSSVTATKGTREDTVVVSWSASFGARQYALYRSSNSSFSNPIPIKTTTDTFFSDPVSSDTFYYYKVKAINFAGESVLSSSTGIGYRIPSNVPQPPVDLHSLHTPDYICLNWTAPDSQEIPFLGFIVHRSDSQNGPYTVLDTVNVTSFYDYTEKSYPHQYWYYVRTYNLRGASAPSDTVSDSRQ